MRLHFKGAYSGVPTDLPGREHPPGAVRFREPEDPIALGREAAKYAVAAFLPALVVILVSGVGRAPHAGVHLLIGVLLAIATAPLHEVLHALCFREDVYMYVMPRQGSMFVIGTEDMSRGRFVFLSLLPNLMLGLLPFLIGVSMSGKLSFLAYMGLVALPMGAGDYLNAYNALRQVPKGGTVYLSGFHSYWYLR